MRVKEEQEIHQRLFINNRNAKASKSPQQQFAEPALANSWRSTEERMRKNHMSGDGRDYNSFSSLPATAVQSQHFTEHLDRRSEEHPSELQSLMRISYAVFCLKKKNKQTYRNKVKITKQTSRKT